MSLNKKKTPENTKALLLHVETRPGDIRVAKEAVEETVVDIEYVPISNPDKLIEYLDTTPSYKSSEVPDLIIIDLHIHETDSREVIDEVISHKIGKYCPLVIFASTDTATDIDFAIQRKLPFVVKPKDKNTFLEYLHTIFDFYFSVVTRNTDAVDPY